MGISLRPATKEEIIDCGDNLIDTNMKYFETYDRCVRDLINELGKVYKGSLPYDIVRIYNLSTLIYGNYDKQKLLNHSVHEYAEYNDGYNDALNTLDDIITNALDNSYNQSESMTLRWVLDEISKLIKE